MVKVLRFCTEFLFNFCIQGQIVVSILDKVVCPNFGHSPALTSILTKYNFLHGSATSVNGVSDLKLFQLSNGGLLFS